MILGERLIVQGLQIGVRASDSGLMV